MWDRIRDALENPILVKHRRSRLRTQPLLTSIVVVVLLNLCFAYAGYELDWFRSGMVAGFIVAIQIVLLGVMGAAQVNASVNGARASGILDFHRVTPMTPTELTLGFFFGAPIREYALFAATLPFTAVCMGFGVPSIRGFLQLMIIVITSAWTIHGVMILNGLMSKAKNPTGSAVGVVVFLVFFFAYIVMGAQYSVNAVEGEHRLNFFGVSLPWLPVVLLYQVPLLFFLLLSATRKMESQRLHPLSKLQAIGAMLTFATLILGGIWRQEGYEVFQVAALYLLGVSALLLTMMVTPTQAEYIKGLYRARKQGKSRLPWRDDLSVNWLCVVIVAGIVLVAGTIAGSAAATGPPAPWLVNREKGPYPLALAAAVLTVAYFGFGLQTFQLRFARRGGMYFGLFLFVTWLVPLLVGWIQALAAPTTAETAAYRIVALSPVAGIAMICTVGDPHIAFQVRAAALMPILLFTFGFNYLLLSSRRQVMRSVYASIAGKERAEIGHELAEPVGGAV